MKRIWQKILVIAVVVIAAIAITGVNSSVYADGGTGAGGGTGGGGTGTGGAGTGATCEAPLGFLPWNCGIVIEEVDGTEELKNMIWTIVGNVAVDITVAAAYLVLGYVIFGGYMYLSSSGDPTKAGTGKKILTQAFIGLAIVMSASVLLNAARVAMANANFAANCVNIADGISEADLNGCVDPNNLVQGLIQWVIAIAGIVAVCFVVLGAYTYITAGGEVNKIQTAKRVILYALIGMAIVGLAEIITAFISNLIRESNGETSYIIETVKEQYEITKIG